MDTHNAQQGRRDFMAKGLTILIGSATGVEIFTGCKDKEDEDKKVSPPEDLMQEHGLLNRVLLIYDYFNQQLSGGKDVPLNVLADSAGIIRHFVEEYHEKQEENYLFPRFQKVGQLTDLVQVLLVQHQVGREITDHIMQLSKLIRPTADEKQQLIRLLTNFNSMYRPHESREDTILFPAFRKLVSQHEYDALGEEFEANEQKRFGKDGFETMVGKVESIEKIIGIYELSQFTPKLS